MLIRTMKMLRTCVGDERNEGGWVVNGATSLPRIHTMAHSQRACWVSGSGGGVLVVGMASCFGEGPA